MPRERDLSGEGTGAMSGDAMISDYTDQNVGRRVAYAKSGERQFGFWR